MYMQTFQSSLGLEQDVSEIPLTARDVLVNLTGDDEEPQFNDKFNPDDAMSESRIEAILNNMDDSSPNLANVLSPDQAKTEVNISEFTTEQENDITMFCELTGSERSYAQTMLEVSPFLLEPMYFTLTNLMFSLRRPQHGI